MGALVSALQRTARGIGKLPRIAGEGFQAPGMGRPQVPPPLPYATAPEDEEEMVEIAPGVSLPASLVRILFGGGTPAAAPAPAPGPAPTTDGQQPSRLRRGLGQVARTLPGILESGITAAATPNIAGGGAVDTFRALQASRQAGLERDILSEERARKTREETRAERESTAKIAESEARAAELRSQAKWREAQAEAARRAKPKEEYITVGTGLFNASTGEWVREPKTTPEPIEDRLLNELADPATPEARRKQIKEAFEVRYGHREAAERNPTEASLAFAAASGDKVAERALKLLQTQRGGPDERQKKARVTSAWWQYSNELNQAEQQFQTARTSLDKTRPDRQYLPTGQMNPLYAQPEDQEKLAQNWALWNEQLHDLETALQTKKNNAQGGLEAVLAEFEVPFAPRRYPHPSTQRRAAPVTETPGTEETLPPEVAAQIKPGKRVKFQNGQVWQRDYDGKLTKVK